MESEPMLISILNLEHIHSKSVYALMDIEPVLNGVSFRIHGVQARYVAGGGTSIHLPTYRTASGTWRAAVSLPPEIVDGTCDHVLGFLQEVGFARQRYTASVA
jgi:hypothetical protein